MGKINKSFWMRDEDQKGDFSNNKEDTFDPVKGYVGIRLQQGVPLLDRDWNELEDIRRYQDMCLRKHYLGDGTPDISAKNPLGGFRIKAGDPGVENDFLITRGRYLVDGLEVDSTDPNKADISYKSQNPKPLTLPPGSTRTDEVYLEVTISEVGTAEDSLLKNAGDVNMPTCLRHKINWVVKVEEGGSMPANGEHVHRSLLATIDRKGSVINGDEIKDKRSRIRTLMPGSEGYLRVNGPMEIWNGKMRIWNGKMRIWNGDLDVIGSALIDGNTEINGRLHVMNDSVFSDLNAHTLIAENLNLNSYNLSTITWADEEGSCKVLTIGIYNGWSYDMICRFDPRKKQWISISGRQFKTKVAPIDDVLEKIDHIHGVYFEWKDDYIATRHGSKKERQIGMIAEEVQAVFPELVSHGTHEDEEFLGIAYGSFTAVLVQAIKELKAQNEALSERVKALEVSKAA